MKKFELTAEEVELVKTALGFSNEIVNSMVAAYGGNNEEPTAIDNLLTRINQWQDENTTH